MGQRNDRELHDSDSEAEIEDIHTLVLNIDGQVDLIKAAVFLHSLTDWFEDLLLNNAQHYRRLNVDPVFDILPVIAPILRMNAQRILQHLLRGSEAEFEILLDIMEDHSDSDESGADDDSDDENEHVDRAQRGVSIRIFCSRN